MNETNPTENAAHPPAPAPAAAGPPRIEIDEPCSKRWGELEGGGTKRFCDACSLHVVDGSALTQGEAEALVQGTDERVCMRLELDADSRPVHVTEDARARVRARLLGVGLAGALVACTDRAPEPLPDEGADAEHAETRIEDPAPLERPTEILGAVCYPEPGDGDAPEPIEIMGEVEYVEPDEEPAASPAELVGRIRLVEPASEPDREDDAWEHSPNPLPVETNDPRTESGDGAQS
ncbi:MAG: hypothetical protein AAFR54_03855 [Planctomycetota bacterium]